MIMIGPNEVEITGRWIVSKGQSVADANCQRISDLTQVHLVKLGHDPSGWDTIYRDPNDGRFWEMTFPQSGLQGGGPPQLRALSKEEVNSKYGNIVTTL